MKIYNCLFRFEDFFEPDEEIDKTKINDYILRHISGELPSFYSYGRHLIPCMAKYYHSPVEGEGYSLAVHKFVEEGDSYDVGNFDNVESAKAFFNNELFPDDYLSIEDGEVLFEKKLENGKLYHFGYGVYFLTMLTALTCKSINDLGDYLNASAKIMSNFSSELAKYGVTTITQEDINTAKDLLVLYYTYDGYRCTVEDILEMPVWAATFPEEADRNILLNEMYKSR